MNFDALRKQSSRLIFAALAALSSVILGSCGGGGASLGPSNGQLAILPSAVTLYAGVPYSFQITGGRKPYTVTSSEPILLPVPVTVNAQSFNVIPANPSVVDAGLPAGSLQVRSVIITVRDSIGGQTATPGTDGIRVAQNFLTGYGVTYTNNCTSGQACSGSDSIVTLVATTNGVLYGNRPVRFDVVRGQFQFVVPETPSNLPPVLVNTITTTTDHEGKAIVRIRVPADARTQLATLRVTDPATGAYVDNVFTITQGNISGQLTIIPNDFTFTGSRTGICGTGQGDFLVFDGDPPYRAASSTTSLAVNPTVSSTNPGRFTVAAFDTTTCLDHATIVITDASNRRATVTVTTAEGTASLPPLVVSPTTADLNDTCGYTTSVAVAGGQGPLSVSSSHPRVSAQLAGNSITITRLPIDPASPPGPAAYPTSAVISVTDGTDIANVTVSNVRFFCP